MLFLNRNVGTNKAPNNNHCDNNHVLLLHITITIKQYTTVSSAQCSTISAKILIIAVVYLIDVIDGS